MRNLLNTLAIGCLMIMLSALVGCETVLTKKQIASEYKNTNVKSFIKQRYATNLMTVLDKISKPESLDDYVGVVLSDGKSVIYRAPFPSSRYYMQKPKKEIARFCAIQNGKLIMKKRFANYVDGLYQNPTATYFQTLNSDIPRSIDVPDVAGIVFGSTNTMNIPINKDQVAALAAVETYNKNHGYIARDYLEAVKNNAFGVFSCVNESGKTKWGVVLKPIAFKAADPHNQLTTNNLYILITPIV